MAKGKFKTKTSNTKAYSKLQKPPEWNAGVDGSWSPVTPIKKPKTPGAFGGRKHGNK